MKLICIKTDDIELRYSPKIGSVYTVIDALYVDGVPAFRFKEMPPNQAYAYDMFIELPNNKIEDLSPLPVAQLNPSSLENATEPMRITVDGCTDILLTEDYIELCTLNRLRQEIIEKILKA